jgi:hypothetical protein
MTLVRDCLRSSLIQYAQDINDFLLLYSDSASLALSNQSTALFPPEFYADQSSTLQSLQALPLAQWCPKLDTSLSPEMYQDIIQETHDSYRACVRDVYAADNAPTQVPVDMQGDPISLTCLVPRLAQLTTPSISVVITVKRATACALHSHGHAKICLMCMAEQVCVVQTTL